MTMRWINYHPIFVFIFAGVAPRLRKARMVRNHTTPVDFITDMFRSQILRYTVATCQILAQFIWMCSNVVALRNAFNSAFGFDDDFPWITVGIVAFILVSEWLGGMSAVALTDCIQGFIMVFGGLSVVGVIVQNWGGWTVLNPETFPTPEFYQTPTSEQRWDWWQNGFLQAGAVFFPVQIQRVYSASNLSGVKSGAWACFLGPWVAQFGFIFMGIMGVHIMGEACKESTDYDTCMAPASPFSAILEQLMDLGGFPQAAAVILYTSALAAIMSTTDSILVSISQIMVAEVVYPIWPNASPKKVNTFGKVVSFVTAALALLLGLLWKGSINLLFQLNEPISMQLFPAFMIGLFSKYSVHPWSIAAGALIGVVTTVIIEVVSTQYGSYSLRPGIGTFLLNCVCVVFFETIRYVRSRKMTRQPPLVGSQALENSGNEESDGTEDDFKDNEKKTKDHATAANEENIGAKEAVNDDEKNFHFDAIDGTITVKVSQRFATIDDSKYDPYREEEYKDPFDRRPSWDHPKIQRFGTHPLTPSLLNNMMGGTPELIKNVYYIGFAVLAVTITTPITPENSPPLVDGTWVVLPDIIRGVPWWAWKAIIFMFLSAIISVPMIWAMPSSITVDEEVVARSGINADVLELEPEEKGARTIYDGPIEALSMRRSSIAKQSMYLKQATHLADECAKQIREKDSRVGNAQDRILSTVSNRSIQSGAGSKRFVLGGVLSKRAVEGGTLSNRFIQGAIPEEDENDNEVSGEDKEQ